LIDHHIFYNYRPSKNHGGIRPGAGKGVDRAGAEPPPPGEPGGENGEGGALHRHPAPSLLASHSAGSPSGWSPDVGHVHNFFFLGMKFFYDVFKENDRSSRLYRCKNNSKALLLLCKKVRISKFLAFLSVFESFKKEILPKNVSSQNLNLVINPSVTLMSKLLRKMRIIF
jgi:hypothetical protein